MMQIDERQAYQIHGIISSDSDSDFGGKDEFDEEYNALKPPPLDYESIRDRIVLISREQVRNVWQERLETVKNDEEGTQTVTSIPIATKKKKKKKSKTKATAGNAESTGIATVNHEKYQTDFPELKTGKKGQKGQDVLENITLFTNGDSVSDRISSCSETTASESPERDQVVNSSSSKKSDSIGGAKPKKNQPDVKKPESLKVPEELVWHSGMSNAIIEQQLKIQRQREASMYEFWMKLARNEGQPKDSANKGDNTVKKKEKTKKKPKPSSAREDLLENVEDTGTPKERKAVTSENYAIKVSKSVPQYANSGLLNQEMWQGTWHCDEVVRDNMQLLSETENKKKTKAKKMPKKQKPTKLTNSNESSSTEPNSVGRTTENDINKPQMKTEAKETPKGSQGDEIQTHGSIRKEIIESLWVWPDNIVTEVQSVATTPVEAEDTRREEVTSTTINVPKTKNKKKKKFKKFATEPQPAIDLTNCVNQNNDKTTVEGVKKETVQGNSITNDSNHDSKPFNQTTPSEGHQYVFDEEFKDFVQNIVCEDSNVIPNLNNFKYEQLHRAYTAYRARKYKDVSTNTVTTQNLPQQNFVHTQNYHHTYYLGSPNPNVVFFPVGPKPNYGNAYGATYQHSNSLARVQEPPQMWSGNFEGASSFQYNGRGLGNNSGMAVTYNTLNGQFPSTPNALLHKSSHIDNKQPSNGSMSTNPIVNRNGFMINERPIVNYSAPSNNGLRYHSVGPNDNFRPNAYQTTMYNTPSASSWREYDVRTGDCRENVNFNQRMTRVPESSLENQYYHDRSGEDLEIAETQSFAEDIWPIENRISRARPESWQNANHEEEMEQMMVMLVYFFFVGIFGIFVANLITSFIFFVIDNMIFIMLFIFICIRFQSSQE